MKARGKVFLNDSTEEFGCIAWHVDTECTYNLVDSTLTIHDCSNAVNLDFDCEKPSHIKKRIQKLDTLINELYNFRQALVEVSTQKKFYY